MVFPHAGMRPRPTTEGISAQIKAQNNYDYWALKKDGEFYLLRNLWENENPVPTVMFDIRISQITEVLLYSTRLYLGLGASPEDCVVISIRHAGLKDHTMTSSNLLDMLRFRELTSHEDEVTTEVETRLVDIEPNLFDLIENFTNQLFPLFDFFTLQRQELEARVKDFLGKK